MKVAGIEEYEVKAKFTGAELEGMLCRHPFLDRDSVIILGDHVLQKQVRDVFIPLRDMVRKTLKYVKSMTYL